MAALENQMQSMLPSADEDTRSTKEFLQHPLETVPYFQRPMGSSTDDPQVGQDDAGNPVFKGSLGEYTVRVNPDQRTLRTKVEEAIPVVKEAVGDYLKDPKLPTKDQLSEFAKQAGQSAVGFVEDLNDLMFKGKGTLGDVVGLAVGSGTGSIPFSVPEGALRTFGGATPPTYQKREAPLFSLSTSPDEVLNIYSLKSLMFREPIAEFAKTVNIPKKGLLGSEFLNQIKKNPSIPETSIQNEVIDPSKRYTRDELLNVVEGRGISQSFANIAENKVTQFEQYQRQRRDAGFVGGTELSYFDIPVVSTIGFPGKKFKAHSQHYEDGTLVHVRGSFIDGSVSFSDFYTGPSGEIVIDSTKNFTGFDTIIDDDNFLLVEEIQSDLLTKGYVKPKSPFDAAFSKAIEEYNVDNPVSYQEAYGDISTDIQKIFKELDEEGIYSPELPIQLESLNSNPFFSPETEAAFTNKISDKGYTTFEELKDYIKSQNTSSNYFWGMLSRLERRVPGVSVVNTAPGGKTYSDLSFDLDNEEFEELWETFYESVKGSEIDHEIHMHRYEDFIDNYNEVLLKKIKEKGLSKELDLNDLQRLREKYEDAGSEGTLSVGLPPIRKNKQAVDEALKVLIAKAAQQGVDKIVIPPAERIAMARGRELKKDKGDRFYRTYVTDLNKSLKELEDNYPVIVHRDVELPYLSKADVQDGDPFGMMNEPDFTEIDEDGVALEDIQDFMDMEDVLQAQTDAQDIANIVNPTVEITEPLGDELLPPSKRTKLAKTSNKGTILDISELIDKYKIEQPRQFAKGGVAMNEQMEMAFMQQGGLKDDGMRQDPVSGNEVPSGSMASEVRDDIPAQLSEGEYVVPADVVRFFGVKFFEDLRTEAKMGLQSMEANGRIGGEPVATSQEETLSDEEFKRLLQQEFGDAVAMNEGGLTFDPMQYVGLGSTLFGPAGETSTVTPPVEIETEASCAARGMVLGPNGVCIMPTVEQITTTGNDDDPAVPVETAEKESWYEDDPTLFTDPSSYIESQLGRGEIFSNPLMRAGALMSGPLGLVAGAANKISDIEGIAKARAALEIARASGSLPAEELERLQKLIDTDVQGNPLVDQDGKGFGIATGQNYLNTLAKNLGFKNWSDISSDKNTFREVVGDFAGSKSRKRMFKDYEDTDSKGRKRIFSGLSGSNIYTGNPLKSTGKSYTAKQKENFKSDAGLQKAAKIIANQGNDGPSAAQKAAAKAKGDKIDKEQKESIISSGNTYSSDPKEAIKEMKDKGTFNVGGRATGGLVSKPKKKK